MKRNRYPEEFKFKFIILLISRIITYVRVRMSGTELLFRDMTANTLIPVENQQKVIKTKRCIQVWMHVFCTCPSYHLQSSRIFAVDSLSWFFLKDQTIDILYTNQVWAVLWPLFSVTEGSDANDGHFGAEMAAMRKRQPTSKFSRHKNIQFKLMKFLLELYHKHSELEKKLGGTITHRGVAIMMR